MIERVRANGIERAYLADGRGPLVLLLHGFPDTAYTWDRVVPTVGFGGEDDHQMKARTYEKARSCFECSYEVIREHPERVVAELVRVVREHAPSTVA